MTWPESGNAPRCRNEREVRRCCLPPRRHLSKSVVLLLDSFQMPRLSPSPFSARAFHRKREEVIPLLLLALRFYFSLLKPLILWQVLMRVWLNM